MHCYDLLTSQPKWNSGLAKSLRDVHSASKVKKKVQNLGILLVQASQPPIFLNVKGKTYLMSSMPQLTKILDLSEPKQ